MQFVILVGNKNDKESRAVSRKEAEIYGKTKGLSQYYETSAVTGENIEALFERMVELIYDELQLDSVVLGRKEQTPIPPKNGGNVLNEIKFKGRLRLARLFATDWDLKVISLKPFKTCQFGCSIPATKTNSGEQLSPYNKQ